MIKVLFNNSCKICSKEINHYKSLNPSQIKWIDINDVSLSTKISGKSHRELIRRLHVIDNQKVYSGVKAFIIMWDKIPKYKWIGKFVSIPGLYHLSLILYELVALILYFKNKHQLNEKK